MGLQLCSCQSKFMYRMVAGPSISILSVVNNQNINSSLAANMNNLQLRSFHVSNVDYPKYRNFRKKARIQREKMDALKATYERLDPEDCPTGCILCPHRNPHIEVDYKNVRLLSQFISPHTGRIYSRKVTGLCGMKQREVRDAIQRSRHIGLMPVTMKYLDFHGDPKLF